MQNRPTTTPNRAPWLVAGAIAATLAMTACSRNETRTTSTLTGETASGALQTEAPPPTYAQQSEQALLALGARHADQGLVLMLDQGEADPALGKSGQDGQAPAVSVADTAAQRTEVVDRVADLLKERPELQLEIRGEDAQEVAAMLTERRTEIDDERVRTGDRTDQGPLQFVLADSEGRFESQLSTMTNGAPTSGS